MSLTKARTPGLSKTTEMDEGPPIASGTIEALRIEGRVYLREERKLWLSPQATLQREAGGVRVELTIAPDPTAPREPAAVRWVEPRREGVDEDFVGRWSIHGTVYGGGGGAIGWMSSYTLGADRHYSLSEYPRREREGSWERVLTAETPRVLLDGVTEIIGLARDPSLLALSPGPLGDEPAQVRVIELLPLPPTAGPPPPSRSTTLELRTDEEGVMHVPLEAWARGLEIRVEGHPFMTVSLP